MSTLLPRITVSRENPHLLATDNGKPFFMLGDTAWELLHRLTKGEVTEYLDIRKKQKFNMIWVCFLPECDCVRQPTRTGILPLEYEDPLKLNPKYVEWTKWVIEEAGKRGIYVGLLPAWGDKMTAPWGAGPRLFNDTKIARQFGELVGKHFGGYSNMMWVLGGDRPPYIEQGTWMEQQAKDLHVDPKSDWRPLWAAMIEGIHSKSAHKHVVTYHPNGGTGTGKSLHNEPWLDANCMQSGHGNGHDVPLWDTISADYARTPVKPTFDGEPNYEDHPVSPWPKWETKNGYFDEYDVRRQLWRSVFAGACGVIYGHHSMWNFADEHHRWINHAKMPWREAVVRPGAQQIHVLRDLMESVPFESLVPDQTILMSNGEEGNHKRAMRDSKGSLIIVYCPHQGRVTLNPETMKGKTAEHLDPRTGKRYPIKASERDGMTLFEAPTDIDWVLILR